MRTPRGGLRAGGPARATGTGAGRARSGRGSSGPGRAPRSGRPGPGIAGHETTSTALTYALHLLGRYPDAQHRVRAEVAEVVGDGTVTPAQVAALAYTTMVLKETMRLYPSAPLLGRRAVEQRGHQAPRPVISGGPISSARAAGQYGCTS